MRVAGYLRVSTEDQAESGLSLQNQELKVVGLAGVHDWEVVAVVEDSGVSAKSVNRPGLQRVLSLVRSRKIDAVVVYKLDRLTRNLRNLLDLLEIFHRFKVRLVSVTEAIDTESATGRMLVSILGVIAEWERGIIAERTSAALGQLKRNGKRYSGLAPFGWRYTEDGEMVPVENERETLRIIGGLTEKGCSLRKIAAELETQGRKPRKAKRWHPTVISSLKDAALAEISATGRGDKQRFLAVEFD